jgi:hypothetical protein
MFDLRRMQGRQAELHGLLATGLADDSHLSDIWRAMRAAVNSELGRFDEARADFAHVLRQLPTLPRSVVSPCAEVQGGPCLCLVLPTKFRECLGVS